MTDRHAPEESEPYGYAMVHFVEDAQGYKEKIFLDISHGDDPERWDRLNGGEPVLVSPTGTTGVRDPFIARDPETGAFYILATDLRVFGADNAGWGAWTTDYSTRLLVWESRDLIHYRPLRTLDTALLPDGSRPERFADVVDGRAISGLNMAWAPEATWVQDFLDREGHGHGGAFVVYWSANPTIAGDRHNRVMWGWTTDFTQKTFHLGGVFVDSGDTIDTTLIRANGRTYRISKDNSAHRQGIFMQTTARPDWWRARDWRTVQTRIGWPDWTSDPGGVEGPAVFADHTPGSSRWLLLVDRIPSAGYAPMVSTDLDAATPWTALADGRFSLAPHTKHGGIVSLIRAEYRALRLADAPVSDPRNRGLVAPGISVHAGTSAADLLAALPATQRVALASGGSDDAGEIPNSVDRLISWDLSTVDASRPGRYPITGTVDTLGANANQWLWRDSSGHLHGDGGDGPATSGGNSVPGAENPWRRSGGFSAPAGARIPYSSTAIRVRGTVVVR